MSPDNVAKESDPALEYDPFDPELVKIPFIAESRFARLESLVERFRVWCDRLAERREYYEHLASADVAPLYHAYGLVRDSVRSLREAESAVDELRTELLSVFLPDYYFVRV